MGDKPAANGLELIIEKAAEVGSTIDKEAAEKLEKDHFADDVCSGGSKDQVERMRGNVIIDEKGALKYDGTIPKILDLVSFSAKAIIISGEDNPAVLEKCSGVLGHKWLPTEDEIEFTLSINISPKTSSGRTAPNLTIDDLPMVMTIIFTKRLCLCILAGFFDPSGLLCC